MMTSMTGAWIPRARGVPMACGPPALRGCLVCQCLQCPICQPESGTNVTGIRSMLYATISNGLGIRIDIA